MTACPFSIPYVTKTRGGKDYYPDN